MLGPEPAIAPAVGTADGLLVEVCDALEAELIPLGIDQWSLPVIAGMTVREVVTHLTAVNDLLADRLHAATVEPIDPAALEVATQAAIKRDAQLTQIEVVASWKRSVDHIRKAAGAVDQVGWVGVTMPSATALTDRAFETWIHANDIRHAIGRASLDPSAKHLRLLCELAVSLLPSTLTLSGKCRPATLQVSLTGPGGGDWTVEFDRGGNDCCSAFMSAAARDLCLLMGARIDPRDFACTVRGDDDASMLVDDLVHSAAVLARL